MTTALRLLAALGAVSAPALFAQLALAQSAQGQTVQVAAVLPPPPYAASERLASGRAVSYGGMQGYDRYGGGGMHPRVQAVNAPAAPTYQGPRLGWSGKAEATQPAERQTPYAPRPYQAASAMPGHPQPYAARIYPAAQPEMAQSVAASAPSGLYAPAQTSAPPPGWTFVTPIGASPAEPPVTATPAPLPTSIYAPAPPVAAVASAAPVSDSPARHYSVHREYGLQPDPIPLPPQFFGNTADMSKPETDDPLHRTVTADGKSHNALQPTDGQ